MKTDTRQTTGRPGPLTYVSCNLPQEHIEALDRLALQTYSSRAQHVRLAVLQYLRRVEQEAEGQYVDSN